jgi:hypothetical protein
MKEVEPQKGLTDETPVDEVATGVFSDEDAKAINGITLMRIYDMLGAILNHLDPEMCEALIEKHKAGGLQGPPPSLNF